MKKTYQKPEATIVSFRAEDELMVGIPGTSGGLSGGIIPFSLEGGNNGYSKSDNAY